MVRATCFRYSKVNHCYGFSNVLTYCQLTDYKPARTGIPTLSANDVSGFGFGYAGNGEMIVSSSKGGSEVNIPSLLHSEDYQMGISMNETPYEVRYVAGGICDIHSEVTTILIPSSVIAIGSDAFRGTRAASITIPAGVHYIGPRAFGNESSLRRLIIRRDENSPELLCAPDAFSGSTDGATLYIDTNLVDVTEAPWNEFTDIRSISELH